MKKFFLLFGLLPTIVLAGSLPADDLLAVALAEQEAFKEGDCNKVASLVDEEVTFYANSRKMSHDQVVNFCKMIKRPFGAGRSPIKDIVTPYRLSANLGYTVRDFTWVDSNEQVMHEIVTKIWQKKAGSWKMIHFQSTVLPD